MPMMWWHCFAPLGDFFFFFRLTKKWIPALLFRQYMSIYPNMRLTDRHVFIDEKVGWKEVVQEAWRLVGAWNKRKDCDHLSQVKSDFHRINPQYDSGCSRLSITSHNLLWLYLVCWKILCKWQQSNHKNKQSTRLQVQRRAACPLSIT